MRIDEIITGLKVSSGDWGQGTWFYYDPIISKKFRFKKGVFGKSEWLDSDDIESFDPGEEYEENDKGNPTKAGLPILKLKDGRIAHFRKPGDNPADVAGYMLLIKWAKNNNKLIQH